MKIFITEIDPLPNGKSLAVMEVDKLRVESEIIEGNEPIRSFNFGNRVFPDILEFAGQMTRFMKDYWQLKDQGKNPLPWDYGDHDEKDLEKVLKHHGLAA
jgi:hypothetical protein